ncbi:ABC transporter ATP-binding protein [Nocardioides sp. NPDC006273]|uniref:ABC transporter ATP-binding protein n=1 Tax=Nocardioides sp. NPDC006273 TaxID=3155598 RepID=UPI0033B3FBE9
MTAALQVSGLRAGHGSRQVLDGLDLTVEGGVTAVLGASGCGKTTLLRCVAGFIAPSAGEIWIGGRSVAGLAPRRRGIGYVPQEGALFPHLDVGSNIAFGLGRNVARAERQARVAELLRLLELPAELADRQPHELSGGQQQRVAVARALAPRPRLVLLDEPFSSLDAGLREESGRAVVRALRTAGAAALLVTHDQGEALSLADQVAVMAAGRFLQVGSAVDVYLTPEHPEVAAFLGSATLLPGEVDGDGRVDSALGEIALATPQPAGPVTLVVRAEQVQVSADAASGIKGVVEEVSFFGHDATIRVRLSDDVRVTARVPGTGIPDIGTTVALEVVGPLVGYAGETR